MSIVRTALPLVLLTSVLTGCAGLQKLTGRYVLPSGVWAARDWAP